MDKTRFGTLLLTGAFAANSIAAVVPLATAQAAAAALMESVHKRDSVDSQLVSSVAKAGSDAPAYKVNAVAGPAEEPLFYVVDRDGDDAGFMILSADDRLHPVLVIAPSGEFDNSPGTPMYDLLARDIALRLDRAKADNATVNELWQVLAEGEPVKSMSYSMSTLPDVRVNPLVKTKWSQSTVGGKNLYNYYTPSNYVCGCVATSGAQIMRYHQFPTESITPISRKCYVDDEETTRTMIGGLYDWSNMPLTITRVNVAIQEAIGKLCYDIGVSVYMDWTSDGSGTGGYCLASAFKSVFGYANAIAYQLNNASMSHSDICKSILSNMDAGYPVEVSIDGLYGGHSIVADGYGFSGDQLYVHLNMGWGGSSDAWYNLPNIGTNYSFDVVDGVVYNIFPNDVGDVISGRITREDDGSAIEGASVSVRYGSSIVASTTTNEKGIYSFILTGGRTYRIDVSADEFKTATKAITLTKSVSTRTYQDMYCPNSGTVGNSWGNDFALESDTPEWPAQWTLETAVDEAVRENFAAWAAANKKTSYSAEDEKKFLMGVGVNEPLPELAIEKIEFANGMLKLTANRDLSSVNGVVQVLYGPTLDSLSANAATLTDNGFGKDTIEDITTTASSAFFRLVIAPSTPKQKLPQQPQ